MSAENCTTHHYACDCREAKVRELVEAAYKLASVPAVLDVLGRNHIANCVCSLCHTKAALRYFQPEADKKP